MQYGFYKIISPLVAPGIFTVSIIVFIAAAAIIVTVPLIVLVLILQRKIISGLLEGGVKG